MASHSVGRAWSRALPLGLAVVLAAWLVPGPAQAAPASGSASTQVGTSGTSTSTSSSGSSSGFDWPELVVAGNAIQFLAPLQFGIVSYLPKGRFAFQYDRQIRKGHWFHVGAALLFDRGDFSNFRMKHCGLESQSNACDKGGVVGFDIYAGYTYKFFIEKKPFVVPYVRGSIGYTYFALPKVGHGDGDREQVRTSSQGLSIRPGGGFRIFLLEDLGIGMDVALPIGFLVHRNVPDGGGKNHNTNFLLGIEVLPVSVEYRF